MLELSRRPEMQNQLREEFQSAGNVSEIIRDARKLDALPLLHGIVKESLRLRPTHPEGQPRMTPADTITKVFNMDIEVNTRINSYPWLLHRTEEIFPKPEIWDPYRWLRRDQDGQWRKAEDKRLENWFWAFGRGPRICLGSNLVYQSKSQMLPPEDRF